MAMKKLGKIKPPGKILRSLKRGSKSSLKHGEVAPAKPDCNVPAPLTEAFQSPGGHQPAQRSAWQ